MERKNLYFAFLIILVSFVQIAIFAAIYYYLIRSGMR
jgi:hypothetical protein